MLRHVPFKKVLALGLITLMGNFALAKGPMCEHIFEDPLIISTKVDFGLRGVKNKAKTPDELLNYAAIKTDLWQTLSKLPPNERAQIEHTLSAVEFFDYSHMGIKLLKNFLEGKKEKIDFSNLYDAGESTKGAPFSSFLNARDNFLRKEKPEVTPELLLKIHSRIMEGGIESVSSTQLGVWRDGHWMGNAAGNYAIKKVELESINANPYLFFEKRNDYALDYDGYAPVVNQIKIWGKYKDTKLAVKPDHYYEGVIHYPHVYTTKQETIDLIKDSHPLVYKMIMDYRKVKRYNADPHVEQAFAKALTEERFARFNKERELIGPVKIGVNEARYIDLVADFQRDLVAIHPVLNGNGRTTRLFMNYLLTKEGLPPVRLVDPFLDVQVPHKEWREYVHKAVVNSAQLQADVAYRVKNNLDVNSSPELLYPGLPERINLILKKQGSDKEIITKEYVKVESEQFNAFIKTLFLEKKDLDRQLDADPVHTMNNLAELFVEYYSSKTLRFVHDKDGAKIIGIRLVETDFVDTFGRVTAGNKYQWGEKINRWYDKDLLVWRGLSDSNRVVSSKDIIGMFKAPSLHLASNSVGNKVRRGQNITEAIKQDFYTYNVEAINGKLVEMAIDHHRSGPRYGESYGYSTSKREVVGKAFAMGAMVVAEYGKHATPEAQAKLKSRINVASFRSLKDVDLGRLKAFDKDFSYIYGRQAEIMGIGATDPDAVMIIQNINAKGEVFETYLRNIEKPNEILVIKGRYVPSEGPLNPELIQQRILITLATDGKRFQ